MKTRRMFVRALGLAVPASWLPGDVFGQPVVNALTPYKVQRADFPADTIRADPQAYLLRMQIADNSIQDYVRASFNVIAQGHREGFQHFRAWYRAQLARRQEQAANRELIAALFGFALTQGLNTIFPGSGKLISKIKGAATWAYGQATSRLGNVPSGDVSRFLDVHQAGVEELVSAWLLKAEEVRNQDPAVWTAVKDEFIFEQVDAAQPTSQPGPVTRQLLEELGVPPPDESTLWRFKGQIMAGQIAEALWAWDPMKNMTRYENHHMALSLMAQYFYPQNPDVYCLPQTRVMSHALRSEECRQIIRDGELAGRPR